MALSGLIAFRCCRCYGSHSRIGLETNHDEVCLGSSVCCTYTRNLDRFDHWYQLVPPFVLHSFHPEFGIAASSFNISPRSAQQQSAQHLQAVRVCLFLLRQHLLLRQHFNASHLPTPILPLQASAVINKVFSTRSINRLYRSILRHSK